MLAPVRRSANWSTACTARPIAVPYLPRCHGGRSRSTGSLCRPPSIAAGAPCAAAAATERSAGAGGDIAVFVSYGASKSASKHPELYGTGIPNGVAATESANNGCSGGAMIPLLSLGVPGDSVTAILLGAFIMKGITPGPMMYVTELPTVYRVFAALMLANLLPIQEVLNPRERMDLLIKRLRMTKKKKRPKS